MKFIYDQLTFNGKITGCLIALLSVFFISSCQDKVDETNMYTFTGQQITDYLKSKTDLSDFAYLTTKVKLSKKSSSTVAELLSARGHFTCFVPTNEAVQAYLDSVYNTKGYPVESTPDSTAQAIVNNCLIDNGTDDAYLTATFVVGSLEKPSFADRYITVRYDTLSGGHSAIYINSKSLITQPDIQLENGVVHLVNKVISPSNSTIASLISETDNLKIFSHLLTVTGWDKLMTAFRDQSYEDYHPLVGKGCSTEPYGEYIPTPNHRDTKYTVFVEPDSLLCAKWGIKLDVAANGAVTNWDEVMGIIKEQCAKLYSSTSDDMNNEDNAVNQFVAYHLIQKGITYNQLVIHYNEQGYAYTDPNSLGIDAWEYYTTMGKNRRILKITEGKTTDGKRINRYVSKFNTKNYAELEVPIPGVKIKESNGGRDYNALNGYYYALDDILYYSQNVPDKVLNERMRFDLTSLLPEQTSNGFRRQSSDQEYHIPDGYFSTMWFTAESSVNYLPGYSRSWRNYEGDEYNIEGQYDVTIQLPPVPYTGTYQLRYGMSINGARGMAQLYFGTNRQNLLAYGLPMDIRLDGSSAAVGWQADVTDEDINIENDNALLIHGYYKNPLYFGFESKGGTNSTFRGYSNCMRKIIWIGTMEPKKTYYMRLKSVLESTTTQLFFDYLELVPKSVYNGTEREDKW